MSISLANRSIIRVLTAVSLFDGHDASINIVRRILQAAGAEVIHLGHNRSVEEIVDAAIQEDVNAIALSSYQGGHVEFLKYMVDSLRDRGAQHIRIFAGGGGVIVPDEAKLLQDYGVTRVYAPGDGQTMGLQGMIDDMLSLSRFDTPIDAPDSVASLAAPNRGALARHLSAIENGEARPEFVADIHKLLESSDQPVPVLGITGTGGAGKSSITDELILRFRTDLGDSLKIALIAIDPSRKKTGGALLGDRIRMNAINHPNIFMRSVATRGAVSELPDYIAEMIAACRAAAFDLIIIETPGIGQGDAGIISLVDTSLYVMTPEFGAQTQLEKIDMLDFADVVAINKFDRRGAKDAYRDVCKQVQRNHERFDQAPTSMPVFGTMASWFNDDGVTALYQALLKNLQAQGLEISSHQMASTSVRVSSNQFHLIPAKKLRYLADIADAVRAYKTQAGEQAALARKRQQLTATQLMLQDEGVKENEQIQILVSKISAKLTEESKALLSSWDSLQAAYADEIFRLKIRGKEIQTPLRRRSLSGNEVRKVALPSYEDEGARLQWRLLENVPGQFPYTAGVFAFKRDNEMPTRMFAGEGDARRTNRRFKQLSAHSQAKRLSTAFDSVTLYGCDPHERPDIYGKVGNSGVSIATLDNLKTLYQGFDLCDPMTSVSMTINGPAPMILAMFLNTAIDQQVQQYTDAKGRPPSASKREELAAWALANVRGTVQADILKEDQGQNTCIFSTEFALKMMADIQAYFIQKKVRNFYSVSISGYHIAEAGANPISQLAFTLANGFTYVEAYLARGMDIDDFAPNLSFFFSNGLCPEYAVIGRVARRIWAVAMRDRYGANARSQKLKYHIQTSGRSLHAQELDFNDIRTTLQALIAIYDHCNSLHTNAFDEAITTPTDDSVRRALAIQLIINTEWGLAMNENPNQGSFIIDELTELVEEAVLLEFERISERGGVLGAMETGYQRAKIQDESMQYEKRKHDGSLPIIGVNTFLNPNPSEASQTIELARSSEEEKQGQIKHLADFHARYEKDSQRALKRVHQAAVGGENVFTELMSAVKVCSLGQLSDVLYKAGGQYRRNM